MTTASVPRRWGTNSSTYTASSYSPVAAVAFRRVIPMDVCTSPSNGNGKARSLISRMTNGNPRTCG